MADNILIIGRIRVGKSTIAPILAEKTGKIHVDLDKSRDELYASMKYSALRAKMLYLFSGIQGWFHYQKPFELPAVQKALSGQENAVIEFGGGQSVYFDEKQRLAGFLGNQPTDIAGILYGRKIGDK